MWPKIIPQRYLVCFISSAGLMVASIAISSFHVALEEMVFHTYESQTPPVKVGHCPPMTSSRGHFEEIDEPPENAEFYWERDLVRAIKQSYYIGYLVSLMPAGLLVDLYGARHVWGAGLFLASIMTLLLPPLAHLGPYSLIIGLILLGFAQGISVPCGGSVVADWAMPYERCTFSATIYIGWFVGWFLVLCFSPNINDILGWSGLLYIGGLLEAIWCIIWYTLYRNNPRQEHIALPSRHSQLLRSFIHNIQLKMIMVGQPPPWKDIILSYPFISLCLLSIMGGWSHHTLLSILNFYLFYVIKIPQTEKLILVGLTYMTVVPSALLHAAAADWLVVKGFMTRTVCRRSFLVLSNLLLIPLLLSIMMWDCNAHAVLLTVLAISYVHGTSLGILYANPVDLSPRHVGVQTALTQSCVVIGSMINKEFIHYFVSRKSDDPSEWYSLFWVTCVLLIVLSTPYLLLGSGELQYWNKHLFMEKFVFEQGEEEMKENSEQEISTGT